MAKRNQDVLIEQMLAQKGLTLNGNQSKNEQAKTTKKTKTKNKVAKTTNGQGRKPAPTTEKFPMVFNSELVKVYNSLRAYFGLRRVPYMMNYMLNKYLDGYDKGDRLPLNVDSKYYKQDDSYTQRYIRYYPEDDKRLKELMKLYEVEDVKNIARAMLVDTYKELVEQGEIHEK